jgi:hypothetical protein
MVQTNLIPSVVQYLSCHYLRICSAVLNKKNILLHVFNCGLPHNLQPR